MGRPLKYKTVEELESAIDEYFLDCPDRQKVVVGSGKDKRVEELPVPTMTGLALHLGFVSRKSLYNYEGRDEFLHTIKKARAFIERHYEGLLQNGNTPGAIFALKNLGWKDRRDHDHTSGGDKININIQKPDGH